MEFKLYSIIYTFCILKNNYIFRKVKKEKIRNGKIYEMILILKIEVKYFEKKN